MSNSLDPNQAPDFVGPDLVQTVCKGYQQTTKVATSVERVNTLMPIKRKLANNVDPYQMLQNAAFDQALHYLH